MDAYVEARNAGTAAKIESYRSECQQAADNIRALAPRLKELIETAQALWHRGIPVGTRQKDRLGLFLQDEFMSESICHKIGFITKEGWQNKGSVWYRPEYVGMIGGGLNGADFVVDQHGYTAPAGYSCGHGCDQVGSKEWLQKAKEFLGGFDEFEKNFYGYVDSL